MEEHIIRAILYQDMSVRWTETAPNMDAPHLNVHQKTRQFVEVELGDFSLMEGEAVLAAFEKVQESEFYHINPAPLGERITRAGRVYRIQIPPLVHNSPGEWKMQFYLATNYVKQTGAYDKAYPFDIVTFWEYSSIFDDGLTVPTQEEMGALYQNVLKGIEQINAYAGSGAGTINTYLELCGSVSTPATLELLAGETWHCEGSALKLRVTGEDGAATEIVSDQFIIVNSKSTNEAGYRQIFYWKKVEKEGFSLITEDGTEYASKDESMTAGVIGGVKAAIKETSGRTARLLRISARND